jgi:hypothetical protein
VSDPASVPLEAEQDRTIDAVVEFVASVASLAPLMMVVDDAHWADAATVRLLRRWPGAPRSYAFFSSLRCATSRSGAIIH